MAKARKEKENVPYMTTLLRKIVNLGKAARREGGRLSAGETVTPKEKKGSRYKKSRAFRKDYKKKVFQPQGVGPSIRKRRGLARGGFYFLQEEVDKERKKISQTLGRAERRRAIPPAKGNKMNERKRSLLSSKKKKSPPAKKRGAKGGEKGAPKRKKEER